MLFRLYTNGQNNTLIMGLKECKAEDEGDFACIVTTAKGSATFDFKLFVTVEGGMDFRSVLSNDDDDILDNGIIILEF